jgi:hypothetical protein
MSWELLLKANYDFVFKPDSDWLGLWNPSEDKILINLSAMSKHIRMGGPNAPKDFSKVRSFGPRGSIDRKTERDLTNIIIETINHESIHEATHIMVEEEIMKMSKMIQDELREQLQDPDVVRIIMDEEGSGRQPQIPDIQDIFDTNKNIYYMLLQEWAVRLMEGKPKDKIIYDLAGYVENKNSEMSQQIQQFILSSLFGDEELDPNEIKMLVQKHEMFISKMKKWLMESLMDIQLNIDNTFMSVVAHLDVEENMPDWFQERMKRARGENNE